MPNIIRVASATVLWALATTAVAQNIDLAGTTSVSFTPMSSGGVLNGCSYTFQTIVQDSAYRQGELTAVNGSVTFWLFDQPSIGLKVGIGNLDRDGKLTNTPPAKAFIKTTKGTTARSPSKQQPSDTPGFVIYAIGIDEGSTAVLDDLMAGTPFQIGFNRRKNGMDVYATVDPEVERSASTGTGLVRKRSQAARQGFLGCMGELLKSKQ